jgi:Ca2+-binding RTX toxin-like protein
MRKGRAIVLVALTGALSGLPSGASAAITCGIDEATGVVTITTASTEMTRIVRSGDDIVVNGSACVGATVLTTETIEVDGTAEDGDGLEVSLLGGPLAPGRTDEGDGSSEIEIATQAVGELWLRGSSGADAIVVSGPSVNLNADEAVPDQDLVFGDMDLGSQLLAWTRGGDDRIAFDGGPDGPSAFPFAWVWTGLGNDALFPDASAGEEHLVAGAGRDVVDYADTAQALTVQWSPKGITASSAAGEDSFTDVRELRLGSGDDQVLFEGGVIGDLRAGAGDDDVWIIEVQPASGQGDRSFHGGAGPDRLRIATEDEIGVGLTVDLDHRTVAGAWEATYAAFSTILTGDTEDRFVARRRDGYPLFSGGTNLDELWLREASRPMYVALAAAPDEELPWLVTTGIEIVVGTRFDDVLVGDGTISNRLVGRAGDDVLVGLAGFDHLFGGAGDDRLIGDAGRDHLFGGLGDDLLRGGSQLDTCDGGGGSNRILGCEA